MKDLQSHTRKFISSNAKSHF